MFLLDFVVFNIDMIAIEALKCFYKETLHSVTHNLLYMLLIINEISLSK